MPGPGIYTRVYTREGRGGGYKLCTDAGPTTPYNPLGIACIGDGALASAARDSWSAPVILPGDAVAETVP